MLWRCCCACFCGKVFLNETENCCSHPFTTHREDINIIFLPFPQKYISFSKCWSTNAIISFGNPMDRATLHCMQCFCQFLFAVKMCISRCPIWITEITKSYCSVGVICFWTLRTWSNLISYIYQHAVFTLTMCAVNVTECEVDLWELHGQSSLK